MKILQIHKYYSKLRGGGSMTAFFETVDLLKKKDHEVIIFSMQDPDNEKTPYNQYFTSHFEIDQIKKGGFLKKIKFALKSVFNFEAQRKLQRLIDAEKPDVAHIHNIYHYLTPAIFHTLKKNKIPVVFKLSDYKAICPNYKLFNKGRICEKCKKHKYYQCFFNKCLKNSFGISLVAALEAYLHRILKSYKKIDYFLAPSEFMKKKCVEFGIPEAKIKILRNVINFKNFNLEKEFSEENHFLYYGRISEEKGIADLILAVKKLFDEGSLAGNRLLIVGKGPEEKALKKLSSELGLGEIIKFLGFKQGNELNDLIRKSKFVVLPSSWYDNSPLVISESQLLGKPVLISELGGSKEMIIENKTGFVFKGDDTNDLAEKIKKMIGLKPEERRQMGLAGRENIKKLNSEEGYYKKLMEIYEKLISAGKPNF